MNICFKYTNYYFSFVEHIDFVLDNLFYFLFGPVIIFIFIFFIYNLKKKKTVGGFLRQYKRKGVQSLGEALIRERVKAIKTLEEGGTTDEFNKVKKFNFAKKDISTLKDKSLIEEEDSKVLKKVEPDKEEELKDITINFNLLENFDCSIPSIEGTYCEFMKAVSKFTNYLTDFITDEEEKQIASLLENREYENLVNLFVGKLEENKEDYQLASLIDSKTERCLKYGCFLGDLESKSRFIVDDYNIRLYKEVYTLLQEIYLRYTNEFQKTSYESLDELLESLSWESIEELNFNKNVKKLGKNVSDILVEDFLNSLKPVKKKSITDYRALRLLLRNTNTKDPKEVGEIVLDIVNQIKNTYSKIKENISVKTDDINQLVKETAVQTSTLSIIANEILQDEMNEKELCETIFDIVHFLGWYPQDESKVPEDERDLLNYFDKLLYSRKSRMAVIRDKAKEAEAGIFNSKFLKIAKKLRETEKILNKIEEKYDGDLVGVAVKITTPRQSEDYFPLKGVIEGVIKQSIKGGNVIKFEVMERNRLRSYVTFTGDNVIFSEKR